MSPAEVAKNIGLFPPVITDFYRAMRFAAMRSEYGFGGGGVAGGRRPYCGNRRGARLPPKVTNSIYILGGAENEEVGAGELSDGGRPKHKETGRRFPLQASDRTRGTFEREIQKRVAPGTLIWADLRESYQWLLAGGLCVRKKANRY